ncbi:ABC transporter permease [Paenibacillus soyae]|uniref:ABC transporter permease n=1 Tax=Paenibacillus soyae TaxID=2969249 RepID=A0A9X2MXD3_9BACL|nr:ABC transporter permease [Paenibacillus soyae]MCR2807633.1 ABC transporter permease [Paenibacillus soyae]
MNIFWREMKASRKSLLLWIVGIAAMVGSGMGKFSGMKESGDAMSGLMADMPKALQAVFGMNGLDISTVTGYYGMLYLYLLIMAAVHASMLGANVLAKEERDKTAEFLLVKPVSRMRLLLEKLLAIALQIGLFTAAMTVCSIGFVAQYADDASRVTEDILRFMAGMLFVQSVFASVGLAIAASIRNAKRAVASSACVMLLTFLLSVIIDISGKLGFASFLTPFQYFAARDILEDGLSPAYAALSVTLALTALVVAFRSYGRRDMQI